MVPKKLRKGAVYMGRKKKIVNKTNVPQYAVERFARCVFDDIRADFARPEVQAEFALWLAEREQNKKTRAAKTAALVSIGCTKVNPRLCRGHKKALAENKEIKKNPAIEQKRFADHTSTIERNSK